MYCRSKALENLDRRMKDIELLLDSHRHMTQRSQVDRALARGTDMAGAVEALRAIVSEPGRGRPPALGALNRAAVVLLSAHLQGYFEDVYHEAAEALLGSKVKDLDVLIKRGTSGFGNPHWELVENLFASLGLPKMTRGVQWSGFGNKRVKARLKHYIELRNKIAHGEQVRVWKPHVVAMKKFVERLAGKFDENLFEVIYEVSGEKPW